MKVSLFVNLITALHRLTKSPIRRRYFYPVEARTYHLRTEHLHIRVRYPNG